MGETAGPAGVGPDEAPEAGGPSPGTRLPEDLEPWWRERVRDYLRRLQEEDEE